MLIRLVLPLVSVLFGLAAQTAFCADVFDGVVGCGGFVQASAQLAKLRSAPGMQPLDFSSVKLKLLTLDGLTKHETECAPTGYYFIPIYDRGSFILKIEGPNGWSFEPPQVPVTIGSDNQCHEGKDINFFFTGFSLSGKVIGSGEGCVDGPEGVSISLEKLDGGALGQTETTADGSFTFPNLFPGSYKVSATHPVWNIAKKTVTSTVDFGNSKVDEPFVVKGYDMKGKIASSADPMADVQVFLYSRGGQVEEVECAEEPVGKGPLPDETPLCVTKSAADGTFSFKNLPCGGYSVVPSYQTDLTKFDIHPHFFAFDIQKGTLKIDKPFQVVGFSVRGKVLDASGVKGVPGVQVKLGKLQIATTNEKGEYTIDRVVAGTYAPEFTKEHVIFAPLQNVKISPLAPVIPDVRIAKYHLCGTVFLDNPADAAKQRDVVLQKPDGTQETKSIKDQGKFCFEVAPGTYKVRPILTASETAQGLTLGPAEREVTVKDSPILNADFSQAKVTVPGQVKCLEGSCNTAITVSITRVSPGTFAKRTAKISSDGSFAFDNILPGTYKFAISYDPWCWTESSITKEIGVTGVNDLEFVHEGYVLTAKLSHDVELELTSDGSEEKTKTFNLSKGDNNFCVKKPGVYTVIPKSCYKFDQETYKFDTSAPSVLTLITRKYLITGTIEVPSTVDQDSLSSLSVLVRSKKSSKSSDGDEVPVTPTETESIYQYSYHASLRDDLTFTPIFSSPSSILFYPKSRDVAVTVDKCQPAIPAFQARLGIFLKGTVKPGVEGVEITVKTSDSGTEATTIVLTDSEGAYSAGPLYDDRKYSVAAHKEGFKIEEEMENGRSTGNFVARKMAHVTITVTEKGSKALGGVLLSLSGQMNYRSNNNTPATGALTFLGLMPGSYFVRPMLKEYVFEPAAQSFEIEEGDGKEVAFVGSRTAFSCFGKVQFLSGESEKGITIEAIGANGEYEEAVTDSDGQFRIRGLAPGATYTVRVKTSDPSFKIDRATPASVVVKGANEDIRGQLFYVFRRQSKFDLSGIVNTSLEYLHNLQVEIALASKPEEALRTVQLGPSSYFEFPSLLKEKYVLRLRSTLNPRAYDISSTSATVSLSEPSAPITLFFNAQPIAASPEMQSGSLYALILASAVVFALLESQRLASLYTTYVPRILKLAGGSSSGGGGGGGGGKNKDKKR